MRRESHVRSCESGRGRLPPATRQAMDWLAPRQSGIEAELAKRHLEVPMTLRTPSKHVMLVMEVVRSSRRPILQL